MSDRQMLLAEFRRQIDNAKSPRERLMWRLCVALFGGLSLIPLIWVLQALLRVAFS